MIDLKILGCPFKEIFVLSVKELIENKHLYQNVKINIWSLKDKIPNSWREPAVTEYWRDFQEIANLKWIVDHLEEPQMIFPVVIPDVQLKIIFPDVKLFCKICNRIEPYNMVSAIDLEIQNDITIDYNKYTVQQFALLYQCQSCKSYPEAILIRRENYKLIYCGRSPIEMVEVHRDIPKDNVCYISKAIVSHNSGFTLAGIFYLRTFIEQWIYSLNSPYSTADQAIDWYMSTLPPDFKNRFKSVKELYGELSSDIHSAVGSDKLFKDALNSIIEHFEARRINRIE